MDILKLIEEHYRLSELKWRKNEEIIETNTGLKRIKYWQNKELLDWHCQWRDKVSNDNEVMLDRMIRTKNGEPAISYGNGWLTLHDEITTSYSNYQDTEKWAILLANMLQCGLESEPINQSISKQLSIDDCFALLPYTKYVDELAKVILEKSCYEAKRRLSIANGLLNYCDSRKLPVLDQISTIKQGKEVYNLLFWVGSSSHPEIGYRGIRKFLEEWYKINGEKGVKELLTLINARFNLLNEQGVYLLAECVTPWELYDCLVELKDAKSPNDARYSFELYYERWEYSRKLVDCISGWLDEKREKVAT